VIQREPATDRRTFRDDVSAAATDRRWPLFGGWMLVLSRKEGESIVVPEHRIEIFVREIDGDRVRIGIKAPDETDIYRSELWQELCFEEFHKGKGERE
jgi:carbon storage regulator